VVASGGTIPVKLQLCGVDAANLSSSIIVLKAIELRRVSSDTAGQLESSGNANPDDNFRYDATLGSAGGYIYNLSTKGLATGTYALRFVAGSEAYVYEAMFQVK